MTSGRDGSLVVHRPSQTRDAAPDGVTNGDVPLRVGERECAAHSPTRNAVDCTRVEISPLVLSFKLAWHLVFRLTPPERLVSEGLRRPAPACADLRRPALARVSLRRSWL